MKQISQLAGIGMLAGALGSCTLLPAFPGDPPEFSSADIAIAEGEDRFPNWPVEPHEIEPLVTSTTATIEKRVGTGAGTTGAKRITFFSPALNREVVLKWKPMPPPHWTDVLPFSPGMLDGINNSPRKEIGAWRLQQLFLDPEDYVVPASVAVCYDVAEVRRFNPGVQPTLEGSQCVLGLFSLWMQDVTVPDVLPDLDRFRRDPTYAYYLANLNLLTYLIKHHDGRKGNILIAKNDARPQVFAIDNGVAFGGFFYNWFVRNWSDLRVPSLRRESIDRLRGITEADLRQALGVLAELRLEDDGMFHHVDPGPNLDPDDGVRYENGTLQFGLTEGEIEDVWERLEDLIEDVDEDDIAVF